MYIYIYVYVYIYMYIYIYYIYIMFIYVYVYILLVYCFKAYISTLPDLHPTALGPPLKAVVLKLRLAAFELIPDVQAGPPRPGKTMPFLPPMTGNGKFIPPINMVMTGG